MSEPRRMRMDGDAFERALLASARGDGPSAEARARAAAAIGIGSGSGSGGGAESGTGTGTGSGSGTGASWLGAGAVKIGVLVLGVALAIVVARRPSADDVDDGRDGATSTRRESTRSVEAASPVERVSRATEGDEREPVAKPEIVPAHATPERALAPRADRVSAARALRTRAPAEDPRAAEERDGSLSAELAAIDEARAALRAGDPARALSLLDDFDRRFPHATLAPEAHVARIEALVAKGERVRARRLAARFFDAHRESPARARVQRLVAAEGAESR